VDTEVSKEGWGSGLLALCVLHRKVNCRGDMQQRDIRPESVGDNTECATDGSAMLDEFVIAEERKPLQHPAKYIHKEKN